MNSKFQYRLFSAIAGVIFVGIFSIVLDKDNFFAVMFFDSNTQVMPYPFTVQNMMWLVFFLGLGELAYRHQVTSNDSKALGAKYLLEKEGLFYDQKTLAAVMQNIHSKDNRLVNLIKALFMRYSASDKSTEQTHQMLNSQLEMMQFRLDVDYNIVRYIAWLIPTLGFVGTVIGISLALAYAGVPGNAEQASFLSELTTRLAVAFNTTLVALLMSVVLMYCIHILQGREERILHHCGEYCLNNFINRLLTIK